MCIEESKNNRQHRWGIDESRYQNIHQMAKKVIQQKIANRRAKDLKRNFYNCSKERRSLEMIKLERGNKLLSLLDKVGSGKHLD